MILKVFLKRQKFYFDLQCPDKECMVSNNEYPVTVNDNLTVVNSIVFSNFG
ncbi:hypothetical protein SAMN06298216_0557 [Spirosomataceae bacterium TFI 002]|nr:hypothetical protein SAMN06298216_0557 [Spirosomataceae bacterium TFI 002]